MIKYQSTENYKLEISSYYSIELSNTCGQIRVVEFDNNIEQKLEALYKQEQYFFKNGKLVFALLEIKQKSRKGLDNSKVVKNSFWKIDNRRLNSKKLMHLKKCQY